MYWRRSTWLEVTGTPGTGREENLWKDEVLTKDLQSVELK